jgi:hypothetical protein
MNQAHAELLKGLEDCNLQALAVPCVSAAQESCPAAQSGLHALFISAAGLAKVTMSVCACRVPQACTWRLMMCCWDLTRHWQLDTW